MTTYAWDCRCGATGNGESAAQEHVMTLFGQKPIAGGDES